MCSSGVTAGFSDYNWVCTQAIPAGAQPNGAGQARRPTDDRASPPMNARHSANKCSRLLLLRALQLLGACACSVLA